MRRSLQGPYALSIQHKDLSIIPNIRIFPSYIPSKLTDYHWNWHWRNFWKFWWHWGKNENFDGSEGILSYFFIPPSNSPNNPIRSQTCGLFCGYLKIGHPKNYPSQVVLFGLFWVGSTAAREIVGLQWLEKCIKCQITFWSKHLKGYFGGELFWSKK